MGISPGAAMVQRERISSRTSTDSRISAILGRFWKSLQNEYRSAAGRSMMMDFLSFIPEYFCRFNKETAAKTATPAPLMSRTFLRLRVIDVSPWLWQALLTDGPVFVVSFDNAIDKFCER